MIVVGRRPRRSFQYLLLVVQAKKKKPLSLDCALPELVVYHLASLSTNPDCDETEVMPLYTALFLTDTGSCS